MRELKEQGFTKGLAAALSRKAVAFPLTIWVVDNSGSMSNRDGHRIVAGKNGSMSVVPSTRWREIVQTVEYHAQLAALLRAPTVFRLLNEPGREVGPMQFGICEGGGGDPDSVDRDLSLALATIQRASPGGATPLVGHIHEIRDNMRALEPQLRRDGTKVAIVLATDGIPTDPMGNTNEAVKRDFVNALRSLEGLPVWIVIRLCTDDEAIVEFWNGLDSQLELSLEVLDDFCSEAQEIHKHNRWLNYALPIHRIREMGFHSRVFDLLDERSLAKDELREFFRLLFDVDGLPDPETDWDTFTKRIADATSAEKPQWNPISKRVEPWINVKQLKAAYGTGWFFW
jgi:Mg-chelatase subunit ChlD